MLSSEGKSAVLTEEMREKIRQTWKIDHLKKHQELALATIVLEKRDCLICVPTGGGKSLCFEAITTLSDMTREQAAMPEAEAEECRSSAATVLVISPLVFLMRSQCTHLNDETGIPALCLSGGVPTPPNLQAMKAGEYRQVTVCD